MPDLSLDWFLFLLRLAFILLLYLFLYQLVQVTLRDLLARAGTVPVGGAAHPVPRHAGATLVIAGPGATGLPPGIDVPLSPLTTIGRHATNLVPLDDPSVSGQHAEISFVRDRWWLRDLDSTNGTHVNGDRVNGARLLKAGDLLQFGRVSGRFHA